MTSMRIVTRPTLLVRTQHALGTTQAKLGAMLGVSRRTIMRWQGGRGGPLSSAFLPLVPRVHAVDPALAAELADACGETLVSLGVVRPPAPPPEPAPPGATRTAASVAALVDAVVCAAAEAATLPPQGIRPAVRSALERAAALDLTVEDLLGALRPKPPAVKTKR